MTSNLATVRPAATEPALPSVGDIINNAGRTTRSEISLLEEQRRMSVSRRQQLATRAQQLRAELDAVQADENVESYRQGAIDRLLRLRRHVLADVESEK